MLLKIRLSEQLFYVENVDPKNYTLLMEVNKDFKNCKTSRSEIDDLQNTNLLDF